MEKGVCSISSIIDNNYIDLYVRTQNGTLDCYWTNQDVKWEIHKTPLCKGVSSSDVAAVRHADRIDIFFVDNQGYLINIFRNKTTGGAYITQVIFKSALIGSNVTALNFSSHIDVFCVDKKHNLIQFAANPLHGFSFV